MTANDLESDFDENADPVVEINRYRETLSRRFRSMRALADFISAAPTPREWLERHAPTSVPEPSRSPRRRRPTAEKKEPSRRA